MTVPADDATMTPQIFRSASEAVALLVPVNVCPALVDVGVVMTNKVPHETGARKHEKRGLVYPLAACHHEGAQRLKRLNHRGTQRKKEAHEVLVSSAILCGPLR